MNGREFPGAPKSIIFSEMPTQYCDRTLATDYTKSYSHKYFTKGKKIKNTYIVLPYIENIERGWENLKFSSLGEKSIISSNLVRYF